MCMITAERITAISALVGVYVAGWAAVQARDAVRAQNETLQEQIRQSRVTLWREMSDKFDIHLNEARFKAAKSWQDGCGQFGKLSECQRVLDFFEDLALLVKGRLIDTHLAESTFEPYFAGYFLAAEALIEKVRITDEGSYSGLKWLKDEWSPDLKIGQFDEKGEPKEGTHANRFNLNLFFNEEFVMCQRAR